MYKRLRKTWLYNSLQILFIVYNLFALIGTIGLLMIYYIMPEMSILMFGGQFEYFYGLEFFYRRLPYCIFAIVVMVLITLNIGLKIYMLKTNKKLSRQLNSAMLKKEAGEKAAPTYKIPKLLIVRIAATVLTLGALGLWIFAYPSNLYVNAIYMKMGFVIFGIPAYAGIMLHSLRLWEFKLAFNSLPPEPTQQLENIPSTENSSEEQLTPLNDDEPA